jgi:hypothetical protein
LLERGAPLRVDPERVHIEAFPEMVGRGDYPRRAGSVDRSHRLQ